jgi:hypothetical protein
MCYGFNATDENVCSSNGVCKHPDECECFRGYSGIHCETPECFGKPSIDPKACHGNGNCSHPDVCVCSRFYDGSECQIPICFGFKSTDSQVCSSNGRCESPNNCTCFNGFSGENCGTKLAMDVVITAVSVAMVGSCCLICFIIGTIAFFGRNLIKLEIKKTGFMKFDEDGSIEEYTRAEELQEGVLDSFNADDFQRDK